MPSSGSHELTLILGAATLLLWGVRMARTGVMRMAGSEIHHRLPNALQSRIVALLTGAGAATILQSSIAVAVFTSSLAAVGVIPVAEGLLLLLGADAGSAVVAALLTLNLKGAWPILMLLGYTLHSVYSETISPLKQVGRILLGIAMILIALTFMGQVSSALAASDLIRTIVSSLGHELFLALLLFAILTWLAHSSIAILLFWASLVQAGITDNPSLILIALLGINLGNAIPPILMTWRQPAPARRIVFGNGLFKALGVILCFIALPLLGKLYPHIPGDASFRVIFMHIAFNLALVVLFAGLVSPTARLLARFFEDLPKPTDEIRPKYIPDTQTSSENSERVDMLPVVALSRETLRILDALQRMLEIILNAFVVGHNDTLSDVLKLESKVNTLFKAVRSFAVELTRQNLDSADQKKVIALLRYTASLENAGDIICKTMAAIPERMKKEQKAFSADGKLELSKLFTYLIGSSQLATEVIMAWRPESADILVQRKREFKKMCYESSHQHIQRLSQGVSNALESSSAHLDLIADMRWISTQITSIGYDYLTRDELPEENDSANDPSPDTE